MQLSSSSSIYLPVGPSGVITSICTGSCLFLHILACSLKVTPRHLVGSCKEFSGQVSSVQSLSHVQLFATPQTVECQVSLSITNSWSLLKLLSVKLVMPSNHLILCCPFSSCLQSFPASGSFPMSQFFASGGQSTGALASASVLPMNIQDWFPLGMAGLISLQSKGLSRVFFNTTVWKHLRGSAFFMIQLSHPYMTIGKTVAWIRWTFVGKVMSLLFNTLSRLS